MYFGYVGSVFEGFEDDAQDSLGVCWAQRCAVEVSIIANIMVPCSEHIPQNDIGRHLDLCIIHYCCGELRALVVGSWHFVVPLSG